MVSQRPGYVPRVSAVPKLHDASEDEITGHHIVDILLCVCVFKDHYILHSTSQPEYLSLEIECVRGSHISTQSYPTNKLKDTLLSGLGN